MPRRKSNEIEGLEDQPNALSPEPPTSTDTSAITYADEEAAEPEAIPQITADALAKELEKATGGTSSHAEAIQQMREKALRARKKERDNIGAGGNPIRPKVKPPTPEELEKLKAARPKMYRVLEQSPRVRAGGRYFTLYAGKVISNCEYDIAHLQRTGVKLQEIVAG